ncbi:hypothetical protein [Pseudoalteromonas rubra]|uniref:hypothetical protein n=1 Tax=Pseudoalteromonas rubra TaxID=43658 RepID=UPI000F778BC5|nr:hypothetical protein [Pseudoalteromonas rubra]
MKKIKLFDLVQRFLFSKPLLKEDLLDRKQREIRRNRSALIVCNPTSCSLVSGGATAKKPPRSQAAKIYPIEPAPEVSSQG